MVRLSYKLTRKWEGVDETLLSVCFLTHYAFTTPDFTLRKDPDVHPIIPGVLFFHGDSVEETFDIYFEKLAGYLRNPDNDAKKKEFDYIMIADQGIYN